MSSTAVSQSFVNESIADSDSASRDDQIGDLNPFTAGSLYPSKKMKMEEEKKQDETMEEVLPEVTLEEDSDEEFDECKKCESCEKLDTMELEGMPGDELFGCKDENFDDEHEKLRFLYYLRSVDASGGFKVECPPPGSIGGIYNRAHFPSMDFTRKAKSAGRLVIDTYNNREDRSKGPKKLEFKRIKNVTGTHACLYVDFYLTIEALDPEKGKTEDYHAVICYSVRDRSFGNIDIFRRESNGEDLLDANSDFAEKTRPGYLSGRTNSGNTGV